MSGYWICGNCFKLTETKGKSYFCKCGGAKLHIDENMIPIIIELNKKGYKTKACCSGHLINFQSNCHTTTGYIYFGNGNNIEKMLSVKNSEWELDNNQKVLRWSYKNPLELYETILDLYKKVLKLPTINNHSNEETAIIPYELWALQDLSEEK